MKLLGEILLFCFVVLYCVCVLLFVSKDLCLVVTCKFVCLVVQYHMHAYNRLTTSSYLTQMSLKPIKTTHTHTQKLCTFVCFCMAVMLNVSLFVVHYYMHTSKTGNLR